MTIRNPHSELDTLIEKTLHETVARRQPRRSVWWRIKMLISAPWVHQMRQWRWSLVVQATIVLLIVFGSNAPISHWQTALYAPLPQFTPTTWVPQEITRVTNAVVMLPDSQEMRTLKVMPHPNQPEQKVVPTPPLNLPPNDVMRPSVVIDAVQEVQLVQFLAYVAPQVLEGGELK